MKRRAGLAASLGLLLAACAGAGADGGGPVFRIADALFDKAQPASLGLRKPPAILHHSVFKAEAGAAQYNHGAVLFAFRNRLFIQWQSSARDEDAPDTRVLMSGSADGAAWEPPRVLAAARPDALVTNGGWWSHGGTLVAFLNVWPNGAKPKAGHVEYITSEDALNWSAPRRLLGKDGKPVDGVLEQDLRTLPGGRILTAIHHQPGLIAKPFYTDDPSALAGWTVGAMENLPHQVGISRELEPSWFLNERKEAVMVFRDQGGSFTVLAARSRDNGASWSTPAATNMPDARAKQSAGNLPDGRAFLLNTPSGGKTRAPLVLTLSRDGVLFDQAWLLRGEAELPPLRHPGTYKRAGYSYPKSIVWNGRLWASYAVNKEDIEVTEIPVAGL